MDEEADLALLVRGGSVHEVVLLISPVPTGSALDQDQPAQPAHDRYASLSFPRSPFPLGILAQLDTRL